MLLFIDHVSDYLSIISLSISCVGALGMVAYMLNRMIWRPRLSFTQVSCKKLEDCSYLFSVGYHSKGDVIIEDTLVPIPSDVLVIKKLGGLTINSPTLPSKRTSAVIGWVQHRTPMYANSKTIIGHEFWFVPRRNVTHVEIEVVVRARVREDKIPWFFDMFPPKTITISKCWKFDVEPPPFEYEHKLKHVKGRGVFSFPLEISEDEWEKIVSNCLKETDR